MSDIELDSTRELLAATVERFVARHATLTGVEPLPIERGVSGAAIARVRVGFDTPAREHRSTQLVLKGCSLVERRFLLRLQDGDPRHVPFALTMGAVTDASAFVCLQDLGDTFRPDSLSPIRPDVQRREAEALADIHSANLHAADLDWLPKTDHDYFTWTIERRFFRWAWVKAVANQAFVREFGESIEGVEAAANRIVDEMTALAGESAWATLVHTDINPSNVLIVGDQPYLIDWDTARHGSLFLDLPHHLSTRDQAEDYRRALSQRGLTITPTGFSDAYRLAARYTGLRYLWWTLEAWRDDPAMTTWVRHYLQMVVPD